MTAPDPAAAYAAWVASMQAAGTPVATAPAPTPMPAPPLGYPGYPAQPGVPVGYPYAPQGYPAPVPAGYPGAPQSEVPAFRQASLAEFHAQRNNAEGKPWKFHQMPIGTSYCGIVARKVTDADVRATQTQRGEKMVVVVPMKMMPDATFPDGWGTMWLKGDMWAKCAGAMAEVGAPEGMPEPGAFVQVTLAGTRQTGTGFNAAYQYRVEYRRPDDPFTQQFTAQVETAHASAVGQGSPAPTPVPASIPVPSFAPTPPIAAPAPVAAAATAPVQIPAPAQIPPAMAVPPVATPAVPAPAPTPDPTVAPPAAAASATPQAAPIVTERPPGIPDDQWAVYQRMTGQLPAA